MERLIVVFMVVALNMGGGAYAATAGVCPELITKQVLHGVHVVRHDALSGPSIYPNNPTGGSPVTLLNPTLDVDRRVDRTLFFTVQEKCEVAGKCDVMQPFAVWSQTSDGISPVKLPQDKWLDTVKHAAWIQIDQTKNFFLALGDGKDRMQIIETSEGPRAEEETDPREAPLVDLKLSDLKWWNSPNSDGTFLIAHHFDGTGEVKVVTDSERNAKGRRKVLKRMEYKTTASSTPVIIDAGGGDYLLTARGKQLILTGLENQETFSWPLDSQLEADIEKVLPLGYGGIKPVRLAIQDKAGVLVLRDEYTFKKTKLDTKSWSHIYPSQGWGLRHWLIGYSDAGEYFAYNPEAGDVARRLDGLPRKAPLEVVFHGIVSNPLTLFRYSDVVIVMNLETGLSMALRQADGEAGQFAAARFQANGTVATTFISTSADSTYAKPIYQTWEVAR